jgi:hypothetical protein
MATHRISILGNVVPDTSGNIFAEQLDVKGTNDLYDFLVWVFGLAAEPTTKMTLHGRFHVPKNYVGTASVIIVWTSTVITNNVVWDFDYRAIGGDDAESLDQATHQESVTVTDTAPGAGMRRMEVSISLTAGNFAVDDTVEFFVSRDAADAADTLVGAVILIDAFFQYADA